MWLTGFDFMVIGLVSGLYVANHFNSGSFLESCPSFSQDGFSEEDSGKLVGHKD